MSTKVTIVAAAAPPPAVEVEECIVCCEPYNKRGHAPVECEYAECKYKVCIKCVRVYLASSTNEAHCMECNKVWSKDFQVKSLKASWINGAYRQHRKQLLVDIEISKLPETMEAAARYKVLKSEEALLVQLRSEISVLKKNSLDEYNQKILEFNTWISEVYTPQRMDPSLSNDDIKLLDKEYHEKQVYAHKANENILEHKRQITLCQQRIYVLNHPNAADADGASAEAEGDKKEKRVFIMSCPANECKGMLSTQYKCGICEMFACSECHEMIGEDKSAEHTCDPNNVASAKAIKKETKQCPGCPNRIYRIEGCSQMWCTGCHTAFDWNTGRIVKSQQLHNPHWVDYQRKKNNGQGAMRAPGDVPCGGMIGYSEIQVIQSKVRRYAAKLMEKMTRSYTDENIHNYMSAAIVVGYLPVYHGTLSHITRNSIRWVRGELQHEQNFETQRCKYIVNEMTKEQLATFIYTQTSKREQKTRVLHIYELLSAVGIDTFNEICNSELQDKDFVHFVINKMIELDALRAHCNGLFAQLSQTYNLCTPIIERFTWKMETQKPTQKEVKDMLKAKPIQDQYGLVTMSWMSDNSYEKIQDKIIEGRERLIQQSLDYVDSKIRDVRKLTDTLQGQDCLEKELDDAKEALAYAVNFGNDKQIKEAKYDVDNASKVLENMKVFKKTSTEGIQKLEDYLEKLMATTDTIKSKVWEGGRMVKSFYKERKEVLSGW